MSEQFISRALISVSNKNGLIDFMKELANFGVRLLSTGGTAHLLRENNIAVQEVSNYTNFPEIMDGRVKTLHPLVHGGILADRETPKHRMQMEANNIYPIDMVVANLYPFSDAIKTINNDDEGIKCAIENIDIGGPSMIRGAAKNYKYVTIVTSPEDYQAVLDDMHLHDGYTSLSLRRALAEKAFALTARYDAMIANWFSQMSPDTEDEGEENNAALHATFPLLETKPILGRKFFLNGERVNMLRYGENPHQKAAYYKCDTGAGASPSVISAQQIQGKDISYNNLNDADAAFKLVSEFSAPAVAIIKHANPCGVAEDDDITTAFRKARACDPVSAFGGIIALNRPLNNDIVKDITDAENGLFVEVILAPDADKSAINLLKDKPQIRLLLTGGMINMAERRLAVKTLVGGFLLQEDDYMQINGMSDCKIVSKRAPTKEEWDDLLFAWKVVKHAKSNAIIYARNFQTVGIGAGQTSRVDAAKFGHLRAKEHLGTKESVVASDAFFPFTDGLATIYKAGVRAVIQPGGSLRDSDIIKYADDKNMAMVFTNIRHFYH